MTTVAQLHQSREEAKKACQEYVEALLELQERLGVWEENEDSCSATYVYAEYLENGKKEKYCHF
jgi:predicted translin family RNA/ssDNA-binding protein